MVIELKVQENIIKLAPSSSDQVRFDSNDNDQIIQNISYNDTDFTLIQVE